uniref:Universal stress protein Sll1388 n=1 Tax=Schistocephalus solidus TaxID=70667 RepID=A0A0X3Q5G7_SCHSO
MAERRVVVLPIDASENAKLAFKWYIKHSRQPHDFLILLHVLEPLIITPVGGFAQETPSVLSENLSKQMKQNLVAGRQLTDQYSSQCREFNLQHKITIHVDSSPGYAVLRIVEQYKANLIVMGCRGTNKVRRTHIGSVSSYVLHHSPVPVMLVPHKEHKKH